MNGSRTLNLMYAEGNYYQSNYNTRLLFIDVEEDPLDVSRWYQRAQPILASDSSQGVYGPEVAACSRGRMDKLGVRMVPLIQKTELMMARTIDMSECRWLSLMKEVSGYQRR